MKHSEVQFQRYSGVVWGKRLTFEVVRGEEKQRRNYF